MKAVSRRQNTQQERPQVYLVQMGARRNYELLNLLGDGADIVRFATSCAWAEDGPNSWLRALIAKKRPNWLRRRTVPGIPADRLLSVPFADIVSGMTNAIQLSALKRREMANRVLGLAVRRDGWHGADILFTVDGNGGLAMIESARRAGLFVISDIVVTPKAYEKMHTEDLRWPGFTTRKLSDVDVQRFEDGYRRLAALSDLMICPSETVIDGIAAIAPEARTRCVLVPYGLSGYQIAAGAPIAGRVLFAGGDATRKGLPYLGLAATRLKERGFDSIQVRVAGGVPNYIKEQPECRDLEFLGKLDRLAMEQEFRSADVFCLPSLAEGSASVVLEAMAAGVPAVVTRSAGSTVTDGIEGRIVPERDVDALANAILEIAENRDLRASLSQAALHRAKEHSVEKLRPRLAEYIVSSTRRDNTPRSTEGIAVPAR